MKIISLLFCLAISINSFCQKIDIPNGVVYKYCDSNMFENAKTLITKDLSNQSSYELCDNIMFIGPVLWKRFQEIKSLKNIEGGNVTLMVDNDKLSGKMTQDLNDSKKIWDCLQKEIKGSSFNLRKATKSELTYYWSVISFDIEEPLVIVETKLHRYILNISPKTMKLLWLDEAP